MRIHLKRCLRSKAAQSLLLLGDLKGKKTNGTSLTKDGILCVVLLQVLHSEELATMKKVVIAQS